MKTKGMYIKILYVFLALLLLVSAVFGGRVTLSAFADTSYTGALEDLQKDESFDLSEYPDNANDYSISVIQIAESTAGELFVYTYQPCQKMRYLVATEINMSLTNKMGGEVDEDEELTPADSPRLYGLTLLNSSGVFCKYTVNDFVVGKDEKRYYNIASIYREWFKDIDTETGNDNTKNAVAFPVGKYFTAATENGDIVYGWEKRKTIKIINPYTDFLRYADGFFLKNTACDGHYVAFSTDMKIDELYEADLSYKGRSVHKYYKFMAGNVTDYGEWQSKYAFLTDEQEFVKERTGWLWGSEAKYKRIQSVEEFIKNEKLTDETKGNLKGKEWVLRFVETDYSSVYDGSDNGNTKYTEVSEVTILRLRFKSAGTVYNLGAVSDKVTGDGKPGNAPDNGRVGFLRYVWNCIVKLFKGTANVVETIVAVIAMLFVLVLLPLVIFILSMVFPAFGAVVKTILKAIGKGLLWLLKGLWWLICLPFKGIVALVRKIKKE